MLSSYSPILMTLIQVLELLMDLADEDRRAASGEVRNVPSRCLPLFAAQGILELLHALEPELFCRRVRGRTFATAIAELVDFYLRHKNAMRAIEDAIAVDREVEAVCQPTVSRFTEGPARHLGRGRDEEKDDAQLRATLIIIELERLCFRWIVRGGWNLDRDRTISSITDICGGNSALNPIARLLRKRSSTYSLLHHRTYRPPGGRTL